MNIVVLHGSPRKGNTYEATQKFMAEMKQYGEVNFTEYFLPKDLPNFCVGCYNCFMKSEENCPHAQYVQPIAKAMEAADGFIFGSPVYVLQMSGGMKVFLDHMGYNFINHRPRFLKQKAMVISTTAGAGLKSCIGLISKNLRFWGVNKIYGLGISMFSLNWEGMPNKKKEKADTNIKAKAKVFYKDLASKKIHEPSLIQVIMFGAGQALMKSYDDTNIDKAYWDSKGWSTIKYTYFSKDIKMNPFKKLVGKLIKGMFGLMIKPEH